MNISNSLDVGSIVWGVFIIAFLLLVLTNKIKFKK